MTVDDDRDHAGLVTMSQAEYARRRGFSKEAVSKAQGRLRASTVVVDGRAKIADPHLADQEWDAVTRPQPGMPRGEFGSDIPDLAESVALRAAAAARREAAEAELAELELRSAGASWWRSPWCART